MKIILYSTGCPKCRVLEAKLNQANIAYPIVSDIDAIKEKGYLSVPILEVDGTPMEFFAAVKWVNSQLQK
jgi:glutaredoxin-related protein